LISPILMPDKSRIEHFQPGEKRGGQRCDR
jgi:hypothetical protein